MNAKNSAGVMVGFARPPDCRVRLHGLNRAGVRGLSWVHLGGTPTGGGRKGGSLRAAAQQNALPCQHCYLALA